MKSILEKILKVLAKAILNKYQPEVIGITGSVGKTSAKEAIHAILASKFKVRQNIKNYNNEIGVPLTIIGAVSPLRSFSGWLKVFIQALKLILTEAADYPKILILEMAVDKPGDLEYLTDLAKCQIGVITAIGDSHIEKFKSIENIRQEKATIIRKLDGQGWAILNFDDEKIKASAKETKARIISFAINNPAEVEGKEIKIKFPAVQGDSEEFGISFKLINKGSFAPVFLPRTINRTSVYAALVAAAVGLAKGMNLVEISQAFKSFSSPNGRLKYIKGLKNTFIIDDTYNSSPASSIIALETLGGIEKSPEAYKYAILGDMLELGANSQAGHEAVGLAVVKNKIDKLIVVGERSRDIARAAEKAGLKPDNIFHFASPEEAHIFIQERIRTGDIILVKGSQGARMEKIVKEIMADPLKAGELLVRQELEWLNK